MYLIMEKEITVIFYKYLRTISLLATRNPCHTLLVPIVSQKCGPQTHTLREWKQIRKHVNFGSRINDFTIFSKLHVFPKIFICSGTNHRSFLLLCHNYSSTLTMHSEVIDGQPGTVVIESFVVDIPEENTKEDICYFVENLLRCNLRTLADVSEESLASPC